MSTFFVHAAFQMANGSVVVAGQVKEGTVSVAQTTILRGREYRIAKIEKRHQTVNLAQPGEMVGLWFDGLTDKSSIASEDLIELR